MSLPRPWRGNSEGSVQMSNGAVLVVEDEQLILLDVESALEQAGFEVVAAHNAAQAIAA